MERNLLPLRKIFPPAPPSLILASAARPLIKLFSLLGDVAEARQGCPLQKRAAGERDAGCGGGGGCSGGGGLFCLWRRSTTTTKQKRRNEDELESCKINPLLSTVGFKLCQLSSHFQGGR